MEFSRPEYLSGLPFSPIGNLPDPGWSLISLHPALAGRFFFLTTNTTWEFPWGPRDLEQVSQVHLLEAAGG